MTRLDLALAALIALGVIVAGILTALDDVVPSLVDAVVLTCLGGLGVRQHHRLPFSRNVGRKGTDS